jgi:hypothetical protein
MNSHLKIDTSQNATAGKLFNNDYEAFTEKASKCVQASINGRYEQTDDFTITFSEFDSVHEKILNNLKERPEDSLNEKVIGF